MKILQCRSDGVELICHPEISEDDKWKRSQDHPGQDVQHPGPRLVLQHLDRVEEEDRVGDDECEGRVECGDGEIVSEDEDDQTDAPHDCQDDGGAEDVMMRGVVSRVQLEYQLVIDSSSAPAPDIDAEEEDHDDAEHGTTIQSRDHSPVTPVQVARLC